MSGRHVPSPGAEVPPIPIKRDRVDMAGTRCERIERLDTFSAMVDEYREGGCAVFAAALALESEKSGRTLRVRAVFEARPGQSRRSSLCHVYAVDRAGRMFDVGGEITEEDLEEFTGVEDTDRPDVRVEEYLLADSVVSLARHLCGDRGAEELAALRAFIARHRALYGLVDDAEAAPSGKEDR